MDNQTEWCFSAQRQMYVSIFPLYYPTDSIIYSQPCTLCAFTSQCLLETFLNQYMEGVTLFLKVTGPLNFWKKRLKGKEKISPFPEAPGKADVVKSHQTLQKQMLREQLCKLWTRRITLHLWKVHCSDWFAYLVCIAVIVLFNWVFFFSRNYKALMKCLC